MRAQRQEVMKSPWGGDSALLSTVVPDSPKERLIRMPSVMECWWASGAETFKFRKVKMVARGTAFIEQAEQQLGAGANGVQPARLPEVLEFCSQPSHLTTSPPGLITTVIDQNS